ncbi:hypothetical protein EJB05_41368 [Eragrostis curvula]|uniref:Uncharacterized protein n=1 Tax=Eragrostis curvula TaxID=38414 RepID=A0A5J9T9E2_9POAL|nr:hypothetical protein EJB05_41368 [Eragrostis curvula]
MAARSSRLSLALLLVLGAAGLCAAKEYDFFYLVVQWPGSYCDTKQSCCYPKSGKPAADFVIHGLWPNYIDGSYPLNCDPDSEFDPSKVSDLLSSLRAHWPTLACPANDGVSFWRHQWDKYGTCAAGVVDEHDYFQAALRLRDQLSVLSALTAAGVNPDGGYYTLGQIKDAIQQRTGFEPYVECNRDKSGNSQLYQVSFCVDPAGDRLMECPVLPHGKACGSRIKFPAFLLLIFSPS